jgi:hypothetical protein
LTTKVKIYLLRKLLWRRLGHSENFLQINKKEQLTINKLNEDTMKVFPPFENEKLNEVEDEDDHSKHPDSYHKHLASITRRSRQDNVNNKSNSFVAHEFEESTDYINHKQKLLPRIWDYMKNSSLFIFHNT